MFKKLFTSAQSWLNDLKDVRSLGLLVFAAIALLVSWSTVGSIQSNYDLQKKVNTIEQQNQVTALENNNVKLKNRYFETSQYRELAARRQFGLAAPGETVYVVPKSIALTYVSAPAPMAVTASVATTEAPSYQKNLDAWMSFFFKGSRQE